MFPIPFNFPFRKNDGSISTIGAEISGGGSSYTLPTASAETKGGVKVGAGLSMDGETLNNSNPTPYTLPTASTETKGGVKVGTGLAIDENGVLSVSGGGGGGTKYLHAISIITSSNYAITTSVITDSNTPFTIETLTEWLDSHGFTSSVGLSNNKVYPASGMYNNTSYVIGLMGALTTGGVCCARTGSFNASSSSLSQVILSGMTFNDVVTTI